MEEKYIFRTKVEKEYTVIRNSLIKDRRLSWAARALLIYLLSKPETWIVTKGDLVKASPAAGKKVSSILKELETTGYIKRNRTRNEKGQWTWYTWVYDIPQPLPILPKRGDGETILPKTMHGKGVHIISTELKKKELKNKNENGGNNNNKVIKNNEKEIIITIPIKNKKEFNKLKKKILSTGWVGSLDEIIKLHNEDPDYVKAWVQRIDKTDLYPRAGLLRKSLRSGVRPPTDEEAEIAKRYRHLEDPLAEFIEN